MIDDTQMESRLTNNLQTLKDKLRGLKLLLDSGTIKPMMRMTGLQKLKHGRMSG